MNMNCTKSEGDLGVLLPDSAVNSPSFDEGSKFPYSNCYCLSKWPKSLPIMVMHNFVCTSIVHDKVLIQMLPFPTCFLRSQRYNDDPTLLTCINSKN